MGKGTGKEGYEAFKASVEGAVVCDEVKAVAEAYANAKEGNDRLPAECGYDRSCRIAC